MSGYPPGKTIRHQKSRENRAALCSHPGLLCYLVAHVRMGTVVAMIFADIGHGAMLTTLCLLIFRQVHSEKFPYDAS